MSPLRRRTGRSALRLRPRRTGPTGRLEPVCQSARVPHGPQRLDDRRLRRAVRRPRHHAHLAIETEGDIDLRGFLGLSTEVAPGYEALRYTVRIRGDGTRQQVEEIHAAVMATSPNVYNLARPVALQPTLVIDWHRTSARRVPRTRDPSALPSASQNAPIYLANRLILLCSPEIARGVSSSVVICGNYILSTPKLPQ